MLVQASHATGSFVISHGMGRSGGASVRILYTVRQSSNRSWCENRMHGCTRMLLACLFLSRSCCRSDGEKLRLMGVFNCQPAIRGLTAPFSFICRDMWSYAALASRRLYSAFHLAKASCCVACWYLPRFFLGLCRWSSGIRVGLSRLMRWNRSWQRLQRMQISVGSSLPSRSYVLWWALRLRGHEQIWHLYAARTVASFARSRHSGDSM